MYGAQHLHEFGGLPVVDFQHTTDEGSWPAADAVAWRVSVDPYDDDRPWGRSSPTSWTRSTRPASGP